MERECVTSETRRAPMHKRASRTRSWNSRKTHRTREQRLMFNNDGLKPCIRLIANYRASIGSRDSVSLFNATSLYLQWRNNTTDDWLHIPYACSIDPNAVNYNNREHICSSKIDQTIIFSINVINIRRENELSRDGQFGENVVQYQVTRVVRRSKVNTDRWEFVLRKYRTIFCCSCWLEMVKERKKGRL